LHLWAKLHSILPGTFA
jgi:hypothetical protein